MKEETDSGAVRCEIESKDGVRLVVRRLGEGDIHGLQAFNETLSAESRRRFSPHGYDEDKVARMIERSVDGTDLTYILLDGSEVVAYFFLWDARDPVPVLGIGITDRFQGKGVGRKLMGILIEDGRKLGRDGLDLTTLLDNDRAFALYERCGFRYLGDVENIAGDGRVLTERHMFLALKDGVKPPERKHAPPE